MVRTPIFFAFFFLVMSACNELKERSDQDEVQSKKSFDSVSSKDYVVENDDKIPIEFAKSIDSEDLKEREYDPHVYPEEVDRIKILETTTYHGDEVWENVASIKWIGLFKRNGKYYLSETEIDAKRVNDPILDEVDEAGTGWEISAENRDTCILLIEQKSNLNNREVSAIKGIEEYVFPGDSIEIDYYGVSYVLSAEGEKESEDENSGWYDVWNYKLNFSTILSDEVATTNLVSIPRFDDSMCRVLFAGDLDGDKIPDLILDISNHYNVMKPTLYLSSFSESKTKPVPVGSHTSVGC